MRSQSASYHGYRFPPDIIRSTPGSCGAGAIGWETPDISTRCSSRSGGVQGELAALALQLTAALATTASIEAPARLMVTRRLAIGAIPGGCRAPGRLSLVGLRPLLFDGPCRTFQDFEPL